MSPHELVPMGETMTIVADLHTHTTNSDGSLTLDQLQAIAREEGLDAVAVTDHDNVHPDLDVPHRVVDGLAVIHGIELRVSLDTDERIDLLGYGVAPTDALLAEIDRLQQNRIERSQAIIDRVEDHLDIELALEGREGMGRPHIARAIDSHPDTDYGYEDAFRNVIGNDCPCYVSRDITDFETGVELLRDACAIVGLAHPFRYDRPGRIIDHVAPHVDAIERNYPYGFDVSTRLVDEAIADHGLIATGGTDAHEQTLGEAGLDQAAYSRFREALIKNGMRQ